MSRSICCVSVCYSAPKGAVGLTEEPGDHHKDHQSNFAGKKSARSRSCAALVSLIASRITFNHFGIGRNNTVDSHTHIEREGDGLESPSNDIRGVYNPVLEEIQNHRRSSPPVFAPNAVFPVPSRPTHHLKNILLPLFLLPKRSPTPKVTRFRIHR